MRKYLKTALLICFIANISIASELTDDYFDLAKHYYDAGNISKSLEYVEQILKIEPTNQEYLNFKVKLLPSSETKTSVARISNTIFEIPTVAIDETDTDIYNKKGNAFYVSKDYNMAIECYRSSVMLNPKNKYAYNNMGLAYLAQKDFKNAEKKFKKAYSTDKTYTSPLDNLAILYAQTGRRDKQLSTLRKAVRINPKDFYAYYLLGNYYKDENDYNNAIKNYQNAINLNSFLADCYLKMAEIYTETEDYEWSNSALSYYNALNPKSDYAYFLMAKNCFKLGQTDKAKALIYKAIFMNNCKEYRYELGIMNYFTKNYKAAAEEFESVLSEHSPAEVYNYLGLCYFKQNKNVLAIANFNKATLLDRQRPIYYYNLALVYKHQKDMENYSKYINTAKKIQPISYVDYIDLACILLETSGKNEAIAIIDDGISVFPQNKKLYETKAQIYELTKDNEKALQTRNQMFEKFVKNSEGQQ